MSKYDNFKKNQYISFAKLLADQQFSKLVVVDEPTTPLAFWEILGGQYVFIFQTTIFL